MENIKYNKPSSDIKDVNFGDKRLNARLEVSVEAMTQRSQASILSGCGTKHGAKAFYALLSNDKFSMEEIGNKVYEATAERRTKRLRRELTNPPTTINHHQHPTITTKPPPKNPHTNKKTTTPPHTKHKTTTHLNTTTTLSQLRNVNTFKKTPHARQEYNP